MKQFVVKKEWSDFLADYCWRIYELGEAETDRMSPLAFGTMEEVRKWARGMQTHYSDISIRTEDREELPAAKSEGE